MPSTSAAKTAPLPRGEHVDHAFLRQLLKWLDTAEDRIALQQLLEDASTYLKFHFAAEERDGGLFDTVLTQAPNKSGKVELLAASTAKC